VRRASRHASTASTIDTIASTVWTALKPSSWSASRMRTSRTTHTATDQAANPPTATSDAWGSRRHSVTTTAIANSVKLRARPVRPTFSPVSSAASRQMLAMRVVQTKNVQATSARAKGRRRMPAG
jgi:hypothetical protein